MSSRRHLLAVTTAFVVGATTIVPARQAPTLDDVLEKSAAYVQRFRAQLSGIVAEETYRQQINQTGRLNEGILVKGTRDLKSDLLLVKPSDSDQHVELRDVFEVDGEPVRNRDGRLEGLLRDPRAGARIGTIIQESARYNIGSIQRNINTPLMALQFLDAANQKRFRFKHLTTARPVFSDKADADANEAAVFRVSTEMWTIEYRERGRGTIIRSPGGGDRPAHGRFWINPADGSVLISEMIVDGGGVIATITVSYQSEPLMGFLVPIEMRESYARYGERIGGRAQYSRFRVLKE